MRCRSPAIERFNAAAKSYCLLTTADWKAHGSSVASDGCLEASGCQGSLQRDRRTGSPRRAAGRDAARRERCRDCRLSRFRGRGAATRLQGFSDVDPACRAPDQTLATPASAHRALSFLLDTNVISELMRREPSAQVVAWIEERPRSRLGITVITQAEILYGIELLPKGRRNSSRQAATPLPSERTVA